MPNASLMLTDSGGIQEETTILGILCLTLRNNTERLITIRLRTNTLVGNKPKKCHKGIIRKRIPKYWDGKAAQRAVKVLLKKL